MRVFLDIETFRPRKEDIFREKVIAIGVLEEGQGRARFFTEWDSSEGTVIVGFYGYLRDLVREYRYVDVVGFNILRFDIPLLIQKGVEYGVGSLTDLNRLWNGMFVFDLFQASLPLNNIKFKGNTLENLRSIFVEAGFDIPSIYGRGSEVAALYESERYDEILMHLERDLIVMREIYRAWKSQSFLYRILFSIASKKNLEDVKKMFMDIVRSGKCHEPIPGGTKKCIVAKARLMGSPAYIVVVLGPRGGLRTIMLIYERELEKIFLRTLDLHKRHPDKGLKFLLLQELVGPTTTKDTVRHMELIEIYNVDILNKILLS